MIGPTEEDEWNLDWFLADVEHVNKNPPATPDGFERVDCSDPNHWPTYLAHVEGMYPAPCPQCLLACQTQEIERLKHREHRRWWKWRIVNKFAHWAYPLGIISGSSRGNTCKPCGTTTRLYWRGKRPYVLGHTRESWACLLKRHHRRTEHATCGLCTKCMPCPTCGSTEPDHEDWRCES